MFRVASIETTTESSVHDRQHFCFHRQCLEVPFVSGLAFKTAGLHDKPRHVSWYKSHRRPS